MPLFSRQSAAYARTLGLPIHFVHLLLAVEDKRFPVHPGIDPLAALRALWADLRSGSASQGGSTIAQQLFDVEGRWGTTRDRTLARKLRQSVWAVGASLRSSKSAILRRYLNAMYWGQQIYGIDAAARWYCDTDRQNLTAAQSFFLVDRIAAPNSAFPGRISELLSRPTIAQALASGLTPV